jgi:hypothetical protein
MTAVILFPPGYFVGSLILAYLRDLRGIFSCWAATFFTISLIPRQCYPQNCQITGWVILTNGGETISLS